MGSPRHGNVNGDGLIWGMPLDAAMMGVHENAQGDMMIGDPMDVPDYAAYVIYTVPANVASKKTTFTDGLTSGYDEEQVKDAKRLSSVGLQDRLPPDLIVEWQNSECPADLEDCGDSLPNQQIEHMFQANQDGHADYSSVDADTQRRGPVTEMAVRETSDGCIELGAQAHGCAVVGFLIGHQVIQYGNDLKQRLDGGEELNFFPERYGALGQPLSEALFGSGKNILTADLTKVIAVAFEGEEPDVGSWPAGTT